MFRKWLIDSCDVDGFAMKNKDLKNTKLIKKACIVTMDKDLGDFLEADILVENGKISQIGEVAEDLEVDEIIDASGMIAIPGFVDCHRHVWQANLRHLASDWSLSEYMLSIRALFADAYEADDMFLGNYIGCLEALSSGITTVVDHAHNIASPEHADAAIKGTMQSGIRSVFCYGMGDVAKEGKIFDSFSTPKWHYDDFLRVSKEYFSDKDQRVRLGVALNELPFSSEDAVKEEIEFTRNAGARLVTFHLSIPGVEHVKQLSANGLLKEDMLITHGYFMSDEELQLLSESGASVVATLDSELQMGMGHGITERARTFGVNYALGVDVVSSNSGDLFNQMRLSLQTQRAFHDSKLLDAGKPIKKVAVKARDVLESATIGGAKAAGLDSITGSLTIGKKADIVLIDTNCIDMQPLGDPVASIVSYGSIKHVSMVMVDGDILVRSGRLIGVDQSPLIEKLNESRLNIMNRVKAHNPETISQLISMGLPQDIFG
jgi:cytosine/adenosine deaminase-related metal-dependent hydrolase